MMAFSFTHRKLLLSLNNTNTFNTPTVKTCLYFCYKLKNDTVSPRGYCPPTCLDICPSICHHPLLPQYNYYTLSQPSSSHNLSPLLISMLILLASVFLLITFYVIYTKLCYNFYNFTPRRTNSSSGDVMREEHEGTMVFHPIWHIPTVGLNPTVINSIKVIKYEEGVKESDCAVCLGEFIVEDDLRILPKCNHAFHVPCIDTWLTSHVTCPLCRAPIDPAVDSGFDRTCEVSTNVIRNNTSAREDESPMEEVVLVVDNNNNNNNNNNVEDSLDGNNKEQGMENNKGSGSQRWSLERGAANLVSRSFSCSGKIFSCRYNNSPSPNS